MKTFFIKNIAVLGLALFSVIPAANAAPCPTGVSHVSGSWWTPSNTETYTMCGCQVVKGQSATGGCNDEGPEQ